MDHGGPLNATLKFFQLHSVSKDNLQVINTIKNAIKVKKWKRRINNLLDFRITDYFVKITSDAVYYSIAY